MGETFGLELGVAGVNLAALAATVLWLKFQAKQAEKDLEKIEKRVELLEGTIGQPSKRVEERLAARIDALDARVTSNRETLVRLDERDRARERRLRNGNNNG